MSQIPMHQLLNMGFDHHQCGRFTEAESIYREVLAKSPDHPETLHLLGTLLGQGGKIDAAVEILRRAVSVAPSNAIYHHTLGFAYLQSSRLEQAADSFREAARLNPEFDEAYFALGNCHRFKGEQEAAIACYRRCLQINENHADAYNNLGLVLAERSEPEAAIKAYRAAVRLRPAFGEAHYNLGNAYFEQGAFDEAITAYQQALAVNSVWAGATTNLGNALWAKGQHTEALQVYRRAVQLEPMSPYSHYNLAHALRRNEELEQAIEFFRQAIRLSPRMADAINGLGNALRDFGQPDEGLACLRRAVELAPANAAFHSDLLFAMHYHPSVSAPAIREEAARWSRQHVEPLQHSAAPHSNTREPDRRLRIGYVSFDFRKHAVAMSMLPLLESHDHAQFEIYCYSSTESPDSVTERCRKSADTWRDISRLTDAQAAQLVRNDRIDILVDLGLHSGGNDLLVFARKPAPLQVTFAGYPGTTGLATIDYRLTDPHLDPPGEHDDWYSEKSIRLPDSFWCYEPLLQEPEVNPLPAGGGAPITFGCLNSFPKINERIIRTWSQILRQVEGSRFMLLAPQGSVRDRTLSRFEREGITRERIIFQSRSPRPEYLRYYHGIDIILDTLPYNGHMTSLDALWMGVPVVTCIGDTVASRGGLSQLKTLGLPELVAHAPEEFTQIAVQLAADLPRLADLRSHLREKMNASPLMDGPRFARGIEAAYRQIWKSWCAA